MLYANLEDAFVQTSLGRLHCKQHEGQGKKMIFLHGLAASSMAFTRLAEHLPDSLGFYLIDLLGHGESEAPEIDYTVAAQAQAVREFMKEKQAQDSYLFGHSYGGWIAASIAQGSYRGNGLVLEDSSGLRESFDDMRRAGTLAETKEGLLKLGLQTNPNKRVISSALESNFSQESWLTRESLSAIVKPTLIIWGSEDALTLPKYAKLFNEYIKGSVLEMLQGVRHTAHYTNAKDVAELLKRFVGL